MISVTKIGQAEKCVLRIVANVYAGLSDMRSWPAGCPRKENPCIEAPLSRTCLVNTKKVVDTCREEVYKHPHLVCYLL